MDNTNAIAPVEKIKLLFERDDVKTKFNEMLGRKAVGFIVSLINVVENNELLKDADRSSILYAAATAASLDLPINPNLGFAYIIPYKGKDGILKAQFQMGYKGFIQLAQRSGLFKTISATPVYDGQLVEENPLTGYKFDFTIKSSKIIGYAGYFELMNGFSKTLYLPIEKMKSHGQKYSQTFKKGYGLWKDDFEAMAVKTVIKLLLSKYAPLSIEMQKAQVADQAVIKDWEAQETEYPDNDLIVDDTKTQEDLLNDEVMNQAKKMNGEKKGKKKEDKEFEELDKSINSIK